MRILDTSLIRKYFNFSLLLIYILLNIRYGITGFEKFNLLFIQILNKNIMNCIYCNKIGLLELYLVNIPSILIDYKIIANNNNTWEYPESDFLNNKSEEEDKIQEQYLNENKFEFKCQMSK